VVAVALVAGAGASSLARVLECVVNVSEGRRADAVDRLAAACGTALLDVHTDADHHRSVFTIAAADPLVTQLAARQLARAAASLLSLADHEGVHPRLGVIDVVPFVALGRTPPEDAIDAASSFAAWIADDLGVPAFLYDDADPEHRTLPSVRRDAFTARAPDFGPDAPHPQLGATAVGARRPLVAVNVELEDDDLALARRVARQVRERDGGLPGVRALGLALPSVARVQVSMNLVDLDATGVEPALVAVRDAVVAAGGRVARVELVGLVPAAALSGASDELREWTGIGPDQTIEGRAAAVTSGGRADAVGDSGGSTRGEGPASPA
jgi:glutamate formiminotransferase